MSRTLSPLLVRFIEFVREHFQTDGPALVEHLRQAVQRDRLTEISAWTFAELDAIEQEAASFDAATLLIDLVSPASSPPALQATA